MLFTEHGGGIGLDGRRGSDVYLCKHNIDVTTHLEFQCDRGQYKHHIFYQPINCLLRLDTQEKKKGVGTNRHTIKAGGSDCCMLNDLTFPTSLGLFFQSFKRHCQFILI